MPLERIRIAPDRQTFIRGNSPFFYFADTVWSAFTNARVDEWKEYLAVRESQGFNALQINILPQWDRSIAAPCEEPFRIGSKGEWDFFKPNGAYFDRAEELISLAAERGMHPALVLLWCDHVPDTWASTRGLGKTMPFDAVQPYIEYVAKRFKPYAPIYLASGDTDFPSDLTISYYAEALRTVKSVDPDCLTTLHPQPYSDIPSTLRDMPELDFYMYQSGHTYEEQYRTWDWATHFMKAKVRRPIVNGEPCYDGHKHGKKQGRFVAHDVRKAFFQSVLCGAKAGFAYGAHGLWDWHREGGVFGAIDFSGTPYLWNTALKFEGAWDAAFCAHIAQEYGLHQLEPLADTHEQVEPWFLAMDKNRDRFVLYLPEFAPVSLPFDTDDFECDLYLLASRRIGKPTFFSSNKGSILQMPEVEGDILIIGRCKR